MNWHKIAGIGVAGNFTGHLEQAGEDKDFSKIKVKDKRAPKGVFPFYMPNGSSHFLHQMPISTSEIILKNAHENHQIEPEMSLLCELQYHQQMVTKITPTHAMAHNDCSIRRPGAKKISEKKNWGNNSKGVSAQHIAIDKFENGGILDAYNLTSYLLRDGEFHLYGLDSPVTGYSYFYTELIAWMTERLRHQQDEGPLENMKEWLMASGCPAKILISIGATKYTPFGESTYLEHGDVIYVILYDSTIYNETDFHKIINDLLRSWTS